MSEIEIMGGLLDGYTQIPNEMFRTPGIKSRAVHVYGNLRSHRSGWKTNVRNVADSTGLSKPTVMGAIDDLIGMGYITRTKVPGEGGRFASYKYRVFDTPVKKVDQGSTESPGQECLPGNPVKKVDQAPGKESLPIKKTLSKKTNEEDHSPLIPQGGDDHPSADRFDEFWEVVPKKVGKQAARKAWAKATKATDPDVIIAGMKRYRDDPNRSDAFTKNPQGWLNDGRWEDDPLPDRSTTTSGKKANTVENWLGLPEGALDGHNPFSSDSFADHYTDHSVIDGSVIEQKELY